MDIVDFDLDDVVIFELATLADMVAFREHFRPQWDGWSDADETAWLFMIRLLATSDLAGLLREAQELVAELGLPDIRFSLDGRIYQLVAAQPPLQAGLAA
jgi:hypothetical protein